jgi:ABC-type glutathione transport system ATPase component
VSLLDIGNLSISFGTHPVVHGLDLTVDRGETVALVGESGSGKSITVLALMGLLPRRALRTGG